MDPPIHTLYRRSTVLVGHTTCTPAWQGGSRAGVGYDATSARGGTQGLSSANSKLVCLQARVERPAAAASTRRVGTCLLPWASWIHSP